MCCKGVRQVPSRRARMSRKVKINVVVLPEQGDTDCDEQRGDRGGSYCSGYDRSLPGGAMGDRRSISGRAKQTLLRGSLGGMSATRWVRDSWHSALQLSFVSFCSLDSHWCPKTIWCAPASPAGSSISLHIWGRRLPPWEVTGIDMALWELSVSTGSTLAF